ncbi:hypothetical protein C9374_008015 [Naegleria lovaniensis]|uniref:Uncharacterized protein n=1 Tax=Naegleria lovaniensis TaxID=51637 RepID=A0AA88KG42_NAELO|nr:uncharacterized protein C9374_008015 [Naegleria lovaniensis]KAG2378867.1 hypothetical protein C9374_008015 [Naegleria lovaniensis]
MKEYGRYSRGRVENYHHNERNSTYHHPRTKQQNYDNNNRMRYNDNNTFNDQYRSSNNTRHYPNNDRKDYYSRNNNYHHPYQHSAHISTNHGYSANNYEKTDKLPSGNKQVTFKESHLEEVKEQQASQLSSTSHCEACRHLKPDLMCKGCPKCIHNTCCPDDIPRDQSSYYCKECYTVQVQIKRDCCEVVCLDNQRKTLITLENLTNTPLVKCPLCNQHYRTPALDNHLSFQWMKNIEFDHEDIIPISLPENNDFSSPSLEDEWNITFSKFLLVVGFAKETLEDVVNSVRFSISKFQDNKKGVCLIGCGSSIEAYQLACFLRKQVVANSSHPMIYFIKPYRALQLELSRFDGSNEPTLNQIETELKHMISDKVKFNVKQWSWRKSYGILTFNDDDHCILVMWYFLTEPKQKGGHTLRFLKGSLCQVKPSNCCEIRNIPSTNSFHLEKLWNDIMERVSLAFNCSIDIIEHGLLQNMEYSCNCIKVWFRSVEFAQAFKLALDGMQSLQVVYVQPIEK